MCGQGEAEAMRVRRLTITNFRSIASGVLNFAGSSLLVGGNNAGKSTVCEALDLVLGAERLYRKPPIDEHDFFAGRYLTDDSKPIQIKIEAVLVDLSDEAIRRFKSNLRRWNDKTDSYVDEGDEGPEAADAEGTVWALPVLFVGQYDRDNDDFIGNTFFAHPVPEESEADEEAEARLGGGLVSFHRDHKRLCGFLFLRALRTGRRALSLQRGSLLDTILRLSPEGVAAMWIDTLKKLQDLQPGIGEVPQLKRIRSEIEKRLAKFTPLAAQGGPTGFFASNLTREHLREVVNLFVSVQPTNYLGPFERLGTGSINLLVFALLTFIADLKGKGSVIFAMEEPEIGLPPHMQRRVTRFVLKEMGQAIVTSHAPAVIEQFEPENIVIIDRASDGQTISGSPIDTDVTKPKSYKSERRQFADAILARAVLVVEGSTESAVFAAASSMLEQLLTADAYWDLDMAGVSIFDAKGDKAVPKYGPMFKALKKIAFAFYDKQTTPFPPEAKADLAKYDQSWESPYEGIEAMLVAELSGAQLKKFLKHVATLPSYPQGCGVLTESMDDAAILSLAQKVLIARKGDSYSYAAILIGMATNPAEIPATIRKTLEQINSLLGPKAPTPDPDSLEDILS